MSDRLGKYPSNKTGPRRAYPSAGSRVDGSGRGPGHKEHGNPHGRLPKKDRPPKRPMPKPSAAVLNALRRALPAVARKGNPFDLPVSAAIQAAEWLRDNGYIGVRSRAAVIPDPAYWELHLQCKAGNQMARGTGHASDCSATIVWSQSSPPPQHADPSSQVHLRFWSYDSVWVAGVSDLYKAGSCYSRKAGAPVPTPVARAGGAVPVGTPYTFPPVFPVALPAVVPATKPSSRPAPWTPSHPGEEPSEESDQPPQPGRGRPPVYAVPWQDFPVGIASPNLGITVLPNKQTITVTKPDGAGVSPPRTKPPGNVSAASSRPPRNPNVRAPRNYKKSKVNVYSTIPGMVLWLVNQATEGLDLVDGLWDAIPYEKRTNRGNKDLDPYDKAVEVFYNWHNIDVAEALENIINNQIEDFAYGQLDDSRHLNKLTGSPTGKGTNAFGTGPSNSEDVPPLPIPQLDIDPDTGVASWRWGKPPNERRK